MKQTFNFLLMLVMVASVLSCKKSEPEPTPAQKIVGKYTLTAQSKVITTLATGAVETTPDNLINRPACAADDITEFTADGKVLFTQGAIICPSSAPASVTVITYILSADAKTVTLTFTNPSFPTDTQILTIVELTGSVLRFTSPFIAETTSTNGGSETTTKTGVRNTTLTKI